jgi:hypothetical protein
MKCPVALMLCLTFLAARATDAAPTRTEVQLGGVVLTVSDSRTAQVFHIVDQLSEWDEATHRQYVRWAKRVGLLTDEDRALLLKHAELRKQRGWGKGFEQSFYVDDPIELASTNAVAANFLSPEEAALERTILLHFEPKLSTVIDAGARSIRSLTQRLQVEAKTLAPLLTKLTRFAEVTTVVRVPVFLVINPEDGSGGGGFNGGKLVVEVEEQPDPLSVLVHESLHALLAPHRAAIEAAAQSVGLNWGVLNEGIAYALAPGITDATAGSDPLAEEFVRNAVR